MADKINCSCSDLIGFVTSAMGGFIHILLVLAIVTILIRVIGGTSCILNQGLVGWSEVIYDSSFLNQKEG